jgi:hypothetical protein
MAFQNAKLNARIRIPQSNPLVMAWRSAELSIRGESKCERPRLAKAKGAEPHDGSLRQRIAIAVGARGFLSSWRGFR